MSMFICYVCANLIDSDYEGCFEAPKMPINNMDMAVLSPIISLYCFFSDKREIAILE